MLKGLTGVTRGYEGLQGVTEGNKGLKVLQGVTWYYRGL